MIIQANQEAYERAKSITSSVSGQNLIKTAFATLLKMPFDRFTLRPGQITKDQFIRGQYVQLTQAERPVIHPLPIGDDSSIPVLLRFEDIPAAFEALEKSIQKNPNNLHDDALALSAQELVNHYKASTTLYISELLSKLSYTTSKTGYTGQPFSPANALCAQLAWLVVNRSKPNPLEQFWKLLYPQVTGTASAISDAQWPSYGEALLDENLAQGIEGQLINYRLVYEQAKLGTINTIDRVRKFHPAHVAFWLGEKSSAQPSEFKNYEEFFTALKKFTLANSRDRLGDDFENTIQPRGDDEFFNRFGFGIQRFLTWYDHLDTATRRRVNPIISPKGRGSLLTIIDHLIGKDKLSRCMKRNSENLKQLLDNNAEIKEFLQQLPFDFVSQEESLRGEDDLNYRGDHCRRIEQLDFHGLIEEVKHGKNLPISAITERFKSLPTQRSKPEDLFNFLFYINDQKIETEIIQALMKEDYLPGSMMSDHNAAPFILRIFDRHSMLKERINLIDRIFSHCSSMGKLVHIELLRKLIQVGHIDTDTLKAFKALEARLKIYIDATDYLNACSHYEPEIHAILNFHDNLESQKIGSSWEMIYRLRNLTDQKKKAVFDYYKTQISKMINNAAEFEFFLERLPELTELILDLLLEHSETIIKDSRDLSNFLSRMNTEQQTFFSKRIHEKPRANPFFSNATELKIFMSRIATLHICHLLKPFILSVVKNLEDHKTLAQGLSPKQKEELIEVLFDKFDELVVSSETLEIWIEDASIDFRKKIFTKLANSPKLPELINTLYSCLKMLRYLDLKNQPNESLEKLLVTINGLIKSESDLISILAAPKDESDSKLIINALAPKIKSVLRTPAKIFSLYYMMSTESYALIFQTVDPHVKTLIDFEDYSSYLSVKSYLKTGFYRDNIHPCFVAQAERVLKIFKMTTDQPENFRWPNPQNPEEVVNFTYATPLMDLCWKLACIPDEETRIKTTYLCVVSTREGKKSHQSGEESPRLNGVKRIYGSPF
jgi:hypothetical protein